MANAETPLPRPRQGKLGCGGRGKAVASSAAPAERQQSYAAHALCPTEVTRSADAREEGLQHDCDYVH
eukprot:CAMPEP_0174283672 /NCGR_PEP_ID=MMETSP0809-20121228/4397_1 /TAXON_ID=73025 ORGANISM="Eutreptiella gymnastica-like, Strain CCMP1594" /NCGR_SAMPLE_ID=MMETSP0809 /ASSEMBLY_ACC=CAM_ASM_000658 /LENGTH=67 /DNA_ID=CAMNT_0015378759 /DNA_START=260 /DNA_END=463 /DNA_ORIENTATION=+